MKWTEYFVLLQTGVAVTEEYNVMVNSEKLIGTTKSDVIGGLSYKPLSL
jgi:hypothetical protein